MLTDFIVNLQPEIRQENKYIFPTHYLPLIVSRLQQNKLGISPLHPARQVNNVYFDTVDYSLFNQSVIGVSHRAKVRLRWYGSLFGSHIQPQLEVKVKQAGLVFKSVFPLPSFSFNFSTSSLDLRQFLLRQPHLPPLLLHFIPHLHPTLINYYYRQYWALSDQPVRLTIDTALHFYRQISQFHSNFNFPYRPIKAILELKYDPNFDSQASKLIATLPLSLQKNSKYTEGILATHLN